MDSIVNQTYTNLEILCINDGSTDATREVLDDCASKDSRIRVIHNEENIKLIRTLNKGIDLASGEYIARMDADDIMPRDKLKKLLKVIQSNSEGIIATGYVNYFGENEISEGYLRYQNWLNKTVRFVGANCHFVFFLIQVI